MKLLTDKSDALFPDQLYPEVPWKTHRGRSLYILRLLGQGYHPHHYHRFVTETPFSLPDTLFINLTAIATGVNLTIDGVQRNTNTSLLLKASHQPRVTVNGARIIEPDAVIANNGVLHGTSNPITPVCIPTRTAPTTAPTTLPDAESASNAAERQRRLQRIRKL